MPTRIGLMGGSFDPIHLGHVAIAKAAYQTAKLDYVSFLPSGNPPHKHALGATALQRLEMTKLALLDEPWARAMDIEVNREGVIYTVDTLTLLKQRLPDAQLYYIIGADTLLELPHWRMPEKVCKLCAFLAADRPGIPDERQIDAIQTLRRELGAQITLLPFDEVDISSTEIRKRLKEDLSTDGLLHPRVRAYIDQNALYREE